MPPLVLDLAEQFRQQLLDRETAALNTMARAWLEVERRLQGEVEAIIAEIQASGRVTPDSLRKMRRYRTLLNQVRTELGRYGQAVETSVQQRSLDAALSGWEHANMLTQAAISGAPGASVQFDRLPVPATEYMVGFTQPGTPLRGILVDAAGVGVQGLEAELLAGIALGRNPRDIARRALRQGLGRSFTRMQTIARTEVLRSYRAATQDNYRQSRVVNGYRRVASKSERTCIACLAVDGREYPLDVPFEAHVNCIVGGTVVSSPPIVGATKRLYDGLVCDIVTISGNHLTVTPNHPVLTDKGWVAAGLLKVGDNVISSGDGKRASVFIDPNDKHRPAVIEDVIKSLLETDKVISIGVPVSTEDFHGDGTDGNVDIVLPDGFLQHGEKAAFFEPSGEIDVPQIGSYFGTFQSHGPARQTILSGWLSPDGILSFSDGRKDNVAVALRHAQSVGISLPSNGDSQLFKIASDDVARDAEGLSNAIFRFPIDVAVADFNGQIDDITRSWNPSPLEIPEEGSVSDAPSLQDIMRWHTGEIVIDRIVDLSFRQFSGHVYNLQTVTGWYVAEGIITHNCRCVAIPTILNRPYRDILTGPEWFSGQSEAVQRGMMGPERYDLWRSGRVSWDDLATLHEDETWGNSWQVTPVYRLKEMAG